jgi:hypothetical protein
MLGQKNVTIFMASPKTNQKIVTVKVNQQRLLICKQPNKII